MTHWFMTAPLLVVFAAGVVLGVPLWMLVAWLSRPGPLPPCVSPYAGSGLWFERQRAGCRRQRDEEDGR